MNTTSKSKILVNTVVQVRLPVRNIDDPLHGMKRILALHIAGKPKKNQT